MFKYLIKKYYIYSISIGLSKLCILILLLSGFNLYFSDGSEKKSLNILFISIDDLRNDLGSLGVTHIYTPHLDSFADESRLFSRHFVQVPTCGSSRAALLRGKRAVDPIYLPNTAILDTYTKWRERSLPGWFRQHGYQTFSLGKISHYPGGLTGNSWSEGPEELPGVWDRSWVPESPWDTPEDMMHGYVNGQPRERGKSPAWESFDGGDDSYPDGWIANEAVEVLEQLSKGDVPWFFAVGFFKPHLPFAAPQSYFDIYDSKDIPEPENNERPSSPSSWHGSGEMLNNYGHPSDPRRDTDYARKLRHAHHAATSYVDAQVGKLLETVKRLELDKNTIVVISSDHGFALGEHGIWGKHSLYEVALKTPLFIQYPGMSNPGISSNAIVESVDLFPTLTDLAGLPTPEGLHGNSLRKTLANPQAAYHTAAYDHRT